MTLIDKLKVYQYIPGFTIIAAVFMNIFTGLPSIAYIAIFYWSIYRSDLVPISLVGVLGLISDSLSSNFLGKETFLYLVLTSLVHIDRRYLLHKEFNYLWQSIGSLILVIGIGKGLLAWQLSLSFSSIDQLLDVAVGIVFFPIWIRLMAPLYSRVATL